MSFLQSLLSDSTYKINKDNPNGSLVLISEGILEWQPKNANLANGPDRLILSCGIHGNETAPIEILDKIVQDINTEKLNASRSSLFIFGHIPAMKAQQRFIDFNLNRLFSGEYSKHLDAIESKRAQEIESACNQFLRGCLNPCHLDLHTAIRSSHHKRFAVFPLQKRKSLTTFEKSLLSSLGIEAVLHANETAKTFSHFSANTYEATSFTLELGKVEPFGKNELQSFQEVTSTLEDLLCGNLIKEKEKLLNYLVVDELIKDHKDYEFLIDENYANFTPLMPGQPIERTIGGERLAKDGESIVFPNKDVPIGQRTGLIVKAIF